ncbi:MAG: SEL1-like repeat protein [Campylobacter concisus]|nr:SEL1-like repeat protein [Campylobacter concisus]
MDIRQNAFYESQRWWNHLWTSISIKAEKSQSITDLEKCQDGDFKICAELGKAYYYGNGVTKDINKAIQLYEKACDGEEMFGCCNLAFADFFNGLKA